VPGVERVDLEQAFAAIEEPRDQHVVAEANGTAVELVKLDGAFVWHSHDREDEILLIEPTGTPPRGDR
jgi:hypothetical protein